MADLSEKLLVDMPNGVITVNGYDQLLALDNAITAAEDMYEALVENSNTTNYAPRITIKAVTHKVFRVEISSQVEFTEDDKKQMLNNDEAISMDELEQICQ